MAAAAAVAWQTLFWLGGRSQEAGQAIVRQRVLVALSCGCVVAAWVSLYRLFRP
jgi:hypothetical protein